MEKQFINLGKYTAAYTEVGKGTPIIFLHGFFGDAWTLNPLVKELQSHYSCINLEMLGFGDSSKPQIRYLVDHQVEFLQNFLTAKQIQEFFLVGYSYGGWVAAAYAINSAQQQWSASLKGMSLIAPAGIRDDSFVGRYNHLKPLLWKTKLVDLALALMAPIFILGGQKKSYQTICEARKAMLTQPIATSFLKDRLKPEDAVDTVENDIHQIEVPTLVIAGECDSQIPLWHCEVYGDKIPQARLSIIPDADHDFVQTHSQEIGNLLKMHWSELSQLAQ